MSREAPAMRRQRPSRTVRRAIGLLLAVAALTSSVGAGSVAAATRANAVTWSIDHVGKVITADVRITLVPSCATPHFQPARFGEERAAWCTVRPEVVAQIRASIERLWNGHKYYCYDVVVRVEIKIDQDPNGPDPTDRVKVRLDQTPGSVVTNVVSRRPSLSWDSSSPSDAIQPLNNGAASSTWAYPPLGGRANAFAHETGHILGLHDGYEEYVDANGNTQIRTRPNHPEDLMADEANSNIDPSTIRRMVERAGYAKHQLKCNYRIDQASFGGRITGLKCDPLGGQWTAKGQYRVPAGATGNQEWIITMNEVTLKGDFVYSDRQVAEFQAPIVVTTEGTAVGRATLTIDSELRARFHLVEQVHTFRSRTNLGGWGMDQNAPLTSIELVWEPIGRCPPP